MVPSTIVLLHFDEPAGIQPADELGNLNNLGEQTGITAPTVVETWCGVGRKFLQSATNGLIATDQSTLGTMLAREVSISALLSLTLTGASGPQTIYARGLNDGTIAERYAYGLEVVEHSGAPGFVDVRMFWSDSSGAVITATAGTFQHAGDGVEFMLTATRRIVAGNVIVRYYIDNRSLGEFSVASTTSGGVTGTTSIGARKSAGAWGRFLNGTIDELAVYDYELSADEIAQTWDRLTVQQPAGFEAFQGLSPPGVGWFANLSSDIARRAKVVGQAIGLFIAAVEEFRATFLPGKCSAWLLPRWEDLYKLYPMPLDSLDVRRVRILARMAADEGYSIPALQVAFSLLLGIDASSVQILENSNEWTDSFSAALTVERWNLGVNGSWTPTSGELVLSSPSGTALSQDPTLGSCFCRTPLDRTDGGQVYVSAKIASFASLPAGAFVGLCFHQRPNHNTLWFGMYNNAGTIQLIVTEGTYESFGAATVLATIAAGPVWLRFSLNTDVNVFSGINTSQAVFSWSTTSATAGFSSQALTVYRWYDNAGFGAYTTSSPASTIGAHFDDFTAFVPNGLAPFAWFAYRDPALPGSYDLIAANALARKVSPAHCYGAVCASKEFLFGDPVAGLWGWTPWGTP